MYRLYREKEKHRKRTDNKVRGNMRSKKERLGKRSSGIRLTREIRSNRGMKNQWRKYDRRQSWKIKSRS